MSFPFVYAPIHTKTLEVPPDRSWSSWLFRWEPSGCRNANSSPCRGCRHTFRLSADKMERLRRWVQYMTILRRTITWSQDKWRYACAWNVAGFYDAEWRTFASERWTTTFSEWKEMSWSLTFWGGVAHSLPFHLNTHYTWTLIDSALKCCKEEQVSLEEWRPPWFKVGLHMC